MQYFTPRPWNLALLSGWPIAVTSVFWTPRQRDRRRLLDAFEQPLVRSAIDTADAVRELQTRSLTTGFDAARAQYAAGVQSGLIERSLLASAAFESRLALLERLMLGPWARSV